MSVVPSHSLLIVGYEINYHVPKQYTHILSWQCNFQHLPTVLFVSTAVEEAVRLITGGAPELAVEGNGPVESNVVLTKAVKRPNEDSDEDEEKGAVVPPVHDIYRARQQKRIR